MTEEFPMKSAQASEGTVATVAVSPFFQARMVRDAPIGALISILIGFGLLFVNIMLTSQGINLDLNQWMVLALGKLIPGAGSYIGAVLSIPNVNDPMTPLSMLKFIYAAFMSFPSCLAWFVGGMAVSSLRIRKGRDEGNMKAGWDVFWYGLIAVEIPLLVFGIMFLFMSILPGSAAVVSGQGFAGSVFLFFLLFFLQPMFWLGLICAWIGSIIGAVVAKKQI